MLMELAYRLAVSEEPLHQADPRQRDRQHHAGAPTSTAAIATSTGTTPTRSTSRTDGGETYGGAPYWGKYIFHDNNRDINYSQVTMRALLELVSAVASADHARPARVAAAALHLQRPAAAERRTSIRSSTASCRCSRTSR